MCLHKREHLKSSSLTKQKYISFSPKRSSGEGGHPGLIQHLGGVISDGGSCLTSRPSSGSGFHPSRPTAQPCLLRAPGYPLTTWEHKGKIGRNLSNQPSLNQEQKLSLKRLTALDEVYWIQLKI